MIAEVIVDVSNSQTDKVFDYNNQTNIKAGTRVLVPFGNRKIQGFIIKNKQNTQIEQAKLKNIECAVDDFCVITEEMLQLMFFMTQKYHLRYIDCLRLFIPSEMRTDKVKPISKVVCQLNKEINVNDYIKSIRKNAKNQLALVEFLKPDIVYNKLDLSSKFSLMAVNKLIKDEYLTSSEIQINRSPNYEKQNTSKHKHTKLQEKAIFEITNSNNTFLLFGVTGSGKTEVYMSVIESVIAGGKTAIMLVPEISLTPQVLSVFKARFKDEVAILHSGLSTGERFDEWRRLITGQAKIAVGARSAIFAPITNIGVIIIDEEHESSYISESNPRYNSFDIAMFRKKHNNCPLVLASATPSLEHYKQAVDGDFKLLELPVRINGRDMPSIQIVDMISELKSGNTAMFSRQLIYELKNCINKKKQAMIFINRRGYSSFLRCNSCGTVAKCTDCDVSLVYHKGEEKLKCHYCGKRYHALTKCPECKSDNLKQGAIGTERVVKELSDIFKNVKILRMDNDTTRTKDAHQKILKEFGNTTPAILVGTQMIAKGHDFKDVTLVGILDADQSLYQSDYKSSEKTFQLITQMSGRAGRDVDEGKVILQTYSPRHYAYKFIANYNYKGFYEKEINIRKLTSFPPFSVILRVLVTSENEELARETLRLCYNDIKQLSSENKSAFIYLEAMKSPIGRIKNKSRFQILIRLLPQAADEIIKNIYNIFDKYNNAKSSIFVEINPNNLS